MARLILGASGNLAAGTIWASTETGTGAQQTTITASTATTTSYVWSPTFTVTNAVVIDAIMLFCAKAATSSSGTVTVALSDDNGVTATREVTINVSDLGLIDRDLVCFKLGATLTGDGGTDYRIGIKSSSNGSVSFYRSATTADWGRLLRTTAAAVAAAASDELFVVGEWTAAATGSSFTCTMDRTSLVDQGPVWIGSRGTLSYGTSAATNYLMQVTGDLVVGQSGTLNIGTVGAEIPRDSTATLQFNCASDGQYGVVSFGTFRAQGLSRTSGKNISKCKLSADVAVNGTSLTVDTDTGWLDNDEIGIASTSRTWSETERGALNGAAGASTLTIDGFAGTGGGVQFAHLGASEPKAEVVLLTRNVVIKSASSTNMSFVITGQYATTDFDWAELRYLGDIGTHTWSGSWNKFPILCQVVTAASGGGTMAMTHCVIRDCEDGGFYAVNAGGEGIDIDHLILYACATASQAAYVPGSHASQTYDHVTVMRGLSPCSISSVGSAQRNITFAGNNGTAQLGTFGGQLGDWQSWVLHSNSAGLNVTGFPTGTWAGLSIRRNNGSSSFQCGAMTITDLVTIGNVSPNASISPSPGLTIVRWTANGEASFGTGYGFSLGQGLHDLTVVDGDFSNGTAHSSGDIICGTAPIGGSVRLINTTLRATTEVSSQSNLSDNGVVASHKHDGTTGNHITWKRRGRSQSDATIYRTAAPSERLTPNGGAGNKLPSGTRSHSIASAATKTISVWIRKSVIGDGAAYNGGEPRLILKRNDSIGVTSDTVLDTASGAAGSWEELTGTTATATADGVIEVCVDCDGTAGWTNVDDWSVT